MSWDCTESALVCFDVAFQFNSSLPLCCGALTTLPCLLLLVFLRSPSHLFIPNVCGLLSLPVFSLTLCWLSQLLFPPPHSLLPISIPICISVVYTCFISNYISMMDLNTSLSPPLLHCFFLEVHLGPTLSLLPLVVHHPLSFHSSFFHLSLSQGDVSRAYLLSPPSPSIPFLLLLKSLRPHSYLKIHPSGSIHHSNY